MNSKNKIFLTLLSGFLVMISLTTFLTGCSSSSPSSTAPTNTAPIPAPSTTAAPTTTTPAPTAALKHIKIGTIMGLTGPLSVPSLAFNRGWGFYADAMREQGGIQIGNDHYVFDFINEDSKGTPEGAGTAATKLVTQDGVKFIIGAMLESEVDAIYQITQPAGVLYAMANINIPGSPSDVKPSKPLLVRLSVSPDDNQPIDLGYIVKTYPNAKTIAVSAPDIGYEGMIDALKTEAAARGLTVNYVEKWAWGTTDFVPTFTRILSYKPDVIFAMNSGQANDQLRAARQLGFKGPFISNSPLGADVFINTVKDPNYLTDVIVNSPDIYHPNAAITALMQRWQAKYPTDPFVSDSIHSYDMPWILAQAMVKAQSIDPAKVMATLETMTKPGDLQVNFGAAYMDGMARFGENAVLYRPFPITRIMNGKTEFVGFFNPEK